MILKPKIFVLVIALLFLIQKGEAQVCTGALGDPIVGAGTDFGRGNNNFGPSLGNATNYTFVSGTPNDGQYTIAKSTNNLNSGWHWTIPNHTPNDPDGYMMVVNANLGPGIFYQTTVNNLCPNATYEFSAYIINILKNPGIKPNVKFSIENTYQGVTTTLREFPTDDIPEGTGIPSDWKKFGTTFITPGNIGVITLKMTNINPGGIGNDLAIDDIAFRACGPIITPVVTNANTFLNNTANICEGDSKNLQLSVNLSSGYNTPQYQWQEFNGTTWVNSIKPGAQTKDLSVNFINAQIGTYKYQVVVAENGNINSTNCRVLSPIIAIIVNPYPTPIATNSGQACIGSEIKLYGAGNGSYKWTGPNNFSSALQNPILSMVTPAMVGTYTLEVTNASGCSKTTTTTVSLFSPVVAGLTSDKTEICEQNGAPIQLQASGGTIYSWLPTEGLSNPSIANPLATPSKTTTYTVTVGNGNCTDTKSIVIIALKNPKADAGVDRKMVKGQSITLTGTASGDHVTYLWTPAEGLNDPTKLNPKANPTEDITYTLTVKSECGTSSDQVFVKVYPKIEIPNTFTPNGDNINDTWEIPSISSFVNPSLKVVNRYGQLVYQGTNEQPWDGKSNGKDLPAGTYYYTLYLDKNNKIYSGWILLVR